MISITIAGTVQSGNTTIKALIEETLKLNGFRSICIDETIDGHADRINDLAAFRNNKNHRIRSQTIVLIENSFPVGLMNDN